jgi:hypothetical protein
MTPYDRYCVRVRIEQEAPVVAFAVGELDEMAGLAADLLRHGLVYSVRVVGTIDRELPSAGARTRHVLRDALELNLHGMGDFEPKQ